MQKNLLPTVKAWRKLCPNYQSEEIKLCMKILCPTVREKSTTVLKPSALVLIDVMINYYVVK